jgi:hypothetical protein
VAYTLAVRLFLEEQTLDDGQSLGGSRGGKYGSQYHPQQQEREEEEETPASGRRRTNPPDSSRGSSSRGSSSSSRPLTVGEVGANWYDGACLYDTLLVKYRCPPDILQEAVAETISAIQARAEKKEKLLTVRTNVLDILVQAAQTDPDKKILLTVSHPSDLTTAQACLATALRGGLAVVPSSDPNLLLPSCDLHVVSNATDAMRLITNPNNNDGNSMKKNAHIVLLPKSARTVQDLLQTAPHDSTVHVLESSWPALQREIPLFGDHVQLPIRGPAPAGGAGGSGGDSDDDVGTGGSTRSTSNLELVAADWAHADGDNTPLERAAVMSPWTRLLSLTELEECLTARIVQASTTNTNELK